MQPELDPGRVDPGEENTEGGGEDSMRGGQRSRTSWRDRPGRGQVRVQVKMAWFGFLGNIHSQSIPNLDSEGVYSLWPRALSPFRAPIL